MPIKTNSMGKPFSYFVFTNNLKKAERFDSSSLIIFIKTSEIQSDLYTFRN